MPVGEVALTGDDASEPPILNPQGTRELILLVDDDERLLEATGACSSSRTTASSPPKMASKH